MTTSIVTGAAGFIGSHICDQLLKLGHEVVSLDDLSGGKRDNVPEGVIFRPGNVTEHRDVNALFALYRPDYVFHLAAYAAENLSHHIRTYNYTVNLVGSANLINAAVNYGVKRLVFTSSAAVYGQAKGNGANPFSEAMRPHPVDPYGIAKYAVEMDLQTAHDYFGIDYTIFRPHNVYGERQNLTDGYRNVVGIFMRQLLQGQPMTIYGDGQQSRQFAYIDDVAPYMARSCEIPEAANQIFNIGMGEQVSINELAYRLCVVSGASLPLEQAVVHLPERQEVRHVSLEHSRFRSVFATQHFTPLYVGLHKMYAWARTQALTEPQSFAGIEIEKNLPESWKEK